MADVGRPPVIDELTLQKLEDGFCDGMSDVQACLYAGIAPATLYNYQNEHPEFIERKELLKESPKLHSKRNVSRKIKAGDVDTSKWYLERKDKDFSNKTDLTSMGEKLPANQSVLSDDAMKKLADEFEERAKKILMEKK